MDATPSLFMLIAAGFVVLFAVGLVVVVVRLRSRKRQSVSVPMAKTERVISREERVVILKKLADGELTQDEAEAQLGQLGSRVPAEMPASPPAGGRGTGRGFLLAALLLVGLVALGGLVVVGHFVNG